MDGTSPQAGSAFAGEKVHFDGNNACCDKKQLWAQVPSGRKSVLIHQLGGSGVLKPWGQQRSSPGGLPTRIPLSREI